MTTLQILIKARALIRKGWTQHAYAIDVIGDWVSPGSPAARQFCPAGALIRVTRGNFYGPAECAWRAIGPRTRDITLWNDKRGRTKQEVVRKFDKAIARLKKKEAA